MNKAQAKDMQANAQPSPGPGFPRPAPSTSFVKGLGSKNGLGSFFGSGVSCIAIVMDRPEGWRSA